MNAIIFAAFPEKHLRLTSNMQRQMWSGSLDCSGEENITRAKGHDAISARHPCSIAPAAKNTLRPAAPTSQAPACKEGEECQEGGRGPAPGGATTAEFEWARPSTAERGKGGRPGGQPQGYGCGRQGPSLIRCSACSLRGVSCGPSFGSKASS